MRRQILFGLSSLVTFLVCTSGHCLAATPAADPSASLYDAPASAAQLPRDWAKKPGWTKLAEDDTSHRFAGCAVLANDKIVAVLPYREGAGIGVYARQAGGREVASVGPFCDGRMQLERTSVAIKENTPGNVSIEVGLPSFAGKPRSITYELAAGAAFIKVTASPGVEKLCVSAPCRFAVLPDFFGDDMLIDAQALPVRRAELPSENFLLQMQPDSQTIVMTVSESRDNDIEITLHGDGPQRRIVRSDIAFGKKPRIWVAVLAGKGIWHEHSVAPPDAGKITKLDWQMPFPALWRVDWSTADKLTDSWEMLLQQPDGKYVMQGWFGQDESLGQRFGKEFGDRDWNKPGRRRWNPVLGSFSFPCWVDSDRTSYLQPLAQRRYTEGGKVANFEGPVVIYPMDRAKGVAFATPIECLTVVDLVRMTLGVGPCQYILDLEGQKRNVKGEATCYARDVINAIYQRGTQLQERQAIEEHLGACVAFIRNVRERIDLYVKFSREMAAYLEEQKRLHPGRAAALDDWLAIVRRTDQLFEANRRPIRTPAEADETAAAFRATLLAYTEKDAAARCAQEMGRFTAIGGAQDGLVASCRMVVKTLRQRAGIAMAVDPELKDVAIEVRNRTQAILRNPTPYEAPRH